MCQEDYLEYLPNLGLSDFVTNRGIVECPMDPDVNHLPLFGQLEQGLA